MEGVGICGGMHGHCLDPHLFARPDDAKRDLAPVGYQYFLEHEDTSVSVRFI